jgi:hypothetical protein
MPPTSGWGGQGAALSLLKAAYLRRDKVAVVVFEGEAARVLLAPTQSVELARARLRKLPVGGATPLAAGLKAAWDLVRTERLREPQTAPTLVLLSDAGPTPLIPPPTPPGGLALAERMAADASRVVWTRPIARPTPLQLESWPSAGRALVRWDGRDGAVWQRATTASTGPGSMRRVKSDSRRA